MTSFLLHHIPPGTPAWIIAAALTALYLHIAGGSLGVISGYGAVLARKGEWWHRKLGTLFVGAMFLMAGAALLLAIPLGQAGNIAGGILALYLVSTAWVTVLRPEGKIGTFEKFAFVAVLTDAIAMFGWGIAASNALKPQFPAALYFGVGTIAALFAMIDLRMLARGGLRGTDRIARHLWRMCAGLFFAAASVFLGQQKVMPKFMHGSPVLWLLGLAPLAFLIFWLVRVRWQKGRTAAA